MNKLWLVSQPLVKDSFKSLYKEHKDFNVVTNFQDLIPWNKNLIKQKKYLFGQADLQANMHGFENVGVMGSGRSLFYKGKYLKGCGITTLAGHWDRDSSGYHSTGSLMASSGIRELIISKFLKHKKMDIIHPCTGILLKSDDYFKKTNLKIVKHLTKSKGQPAAIDLNHCAITVKDGDFSRYSNYVWLLNQTSSGTRGTLHAFLTLMAQDLGVINNDVKSVFEKLFINFNLGWKNLLKSQSIGLCWGSYNNNFTITGQFLDLETYSYYGQPLMGADYQNKERVKAVSDIQVGATYITYLSQVKWFINCIDNFLINQFKRDKFQSNFEKLWINQAERIKKIFKDEVMEPWNEVMEKQMVVNSMFALYDQHYDLTSADKKILKKVCSTIYDLYILGDGSNDFGLDFITVPTKMNPAEYGKSSTHTIIPKFFKSYFKQTSESENFNKNLDDLYRCKNIDNVFDKIKTLKF